MEEKPILEVLQGFNLCLNHLFIAWGFVVFGIASCFILSVSVNFIGLYGLSSEYAGIGASVTVSKSPDVSNCDTAERVTPKNSAASVTVTASPLSRSLLSDLMALLMSLRFSFM